MNLSAPTLPMFVISLVLVILAVVVALGYVHGLPVSAFWVAVVGYAVLAVANLAKGL